MTFRINFIPIVKLCIFMSLDYVSERFALTLETCKYWTKQLFIALYSLNAKQRQTMHVCDGWKWCERVINVWNVNLVTSNERTNRYACVWCVYSPIEVLCGVSTKARHLFVYPEWSHFKCKQRRGKQQKLAFSPIASMFDFFSPFIFE